MKKIFILLALALFVSGCSLPWQKKPADVRQEIDAAVNAAAQPKSVDQVSAEGTVYTSTNPIAPTTPEEYQGSMIAAWKAYVAAGGSLDFAVVAAADRQQQVGLARTLYTSIVGLTVPAQFTATHLEAVIAVSQWQEVLAAMLAGTPFAQEEKIAQAQQHLDKLLNSTPWLDLGTR